MDANQLGQLAFVIGMAIIAPFILRWLACANHVFVNRNIHSKQKKRK